MGKAQSCCGWGSLTPAVGVAQSCCGCGSVLLWVWFSPAVDVAQSCCGWGSVLLWVGLSPAVGGAQSCCGWGSVLLWVRLSSATVQPTPKSKVGRGLRAQSGYKSEVGRPRSYCSTSIALLRETCNGCIYVYTVCPLICFAPVVHSLAYLSRAGAISSSSSVVTLKVRSSRAVRCTVCPHTYSVPLCRYCQLW